MLPVIAIVGRPNVGKSTLFNSLTKSRDALVADVPGLTRDRQYGTGRFEQRSFIVIDTGGLEEQAAGIETLMAKQALLAVEEADRVIFMTDGQAGLTAHDQKIAEHLRKLGKPIFLVVNKIDGVDPDIALADFHSIGLGQPHAIAAAHGRGIQALLKAILADLPEILPPEGVDAGIKIAIVGRPNVGKSTLVNRMLGEERVLVFDMPGTTRDSLYIPLDRRGKRYTVIDTAGVRRRARVTEAIEKFSIVKTLKAIEEAHVVILVVDARTGIVEQDTGLLGFIIDAGRALVIAVNKWDGLEPEQKEQVKESLHRRLAFVDFAKPHFISALHGTGVGDLFKFVDKAYASAGKEMPTPVVTRILEEAVARHQPPLVHGRRVKPRYAHAGGHYPPVIVVHGNQVDALPNAYRRYLAAYYRKALKLEGTPIRIEFKEGENPYKDRKNVLTPSQIKKRKRLIRHVKR